MSLATPRSTRTPCNESGEMRTARRLPGGVACEVMRRTPTSATGPGPRGQGPRSRSDRNFTPGYPKPANREGPGQVSELGFDRPSSRLGSHEEDRLQSLTTGE